MRINSEILITKIEDKQNSNKENYLLISFVDMETGDNFSVTTKNLEFMRLNQFQKYNCILNLSSSKYGLKLDIEQIGKEQLGTI